MPRPPSKPPSDDEPVETLEKLPDARPPSTSDLGLSKAQIREVVKAMLPVVRRVGFPEHVHPLEVVNAGFIMAITKPISERPSSENWRRYVAWMCTLAECAALTMRKSKHQRLLGQGHAEDAMDELLPVSGHEDRIAARQLIRKAWPLLKPRDREILVAHDVEGKTLDAIALEHQRPSSTVGWRHRRALRNLRRIIKSMIAVFLLFFTKKVRAQGLWLTQRVSQLVPHATQTACAMTVTVTCGLTVPSVSMATADHHEVPVATLAAFPRPTFAAAMVPTEPSVATEVEPEKPIVIDATEIQWSAADMKATTFVRYLQATMLPFAFLVAPAMTQVACSGSGQQTPPPQEPEERYTVIDRWANMCDNERRRGNECPSRADWCASIGMRPSPTGCE